MLFGATVALCNTNKHPIMYSLRLTRFILHAASAAVLLSSVAHAQLLLSGRIAGEFTDTPGTYDSVYNAPDKSSAWFKSGVPEHAWDKQTAVEFNQQFFTDIGPGLVATDIFKITNGRTLLGTTATSSHFNLWVDLTAPESQSHLLTAIPFTILNTPNGPDPQSVDDWYSITAGPISPFKVGDYMVQFTFTAPDNFSVHENTSAYAGTLTVAFTPVPEPSTYALGGAALLAGLVIMRARRRSQAGPVAAA